MRFQNCTLAYVKELYLQKVIATQNNDQEKLTYLINTYPELFNAQFLMDFLKNEFRRQKNGLADDIVMQYELFQYH